MSTMLSFLLAARASASCDAASLQHAIEDAETAFADLEAERFDAAVGEARSTLTCVADALSPVQAAGYHRMRALQAFLQGDSAATVLYFQAVLGTQPGYELPVGIAPEGHPLRNDFQRAMEFSDTAVFDLPPPAEGWLNVDGKRADVAPAGRPFLLQWFNEAGEVELTGWVPVGSPLPGYTQRTESSVVSAPPPAEPLPAPSAVTGEPSAQRDHSGRAFTVAGLAAGAIGLGLYGTAFATHASYGTAVEEGDEARIRSTHTTTNVLTIAGIAGMGSGAGLVLWGAL